MSDTPSPVLESGMHVRARHFNFDDRHVSFDVAPVDPERRAEVLEGVLLIRRVEMLDYTQYLVGGHPVEPESIEFLGYPA
jgi:hypothetical protein